MYELTLSAHSVLRWLVIYLVIAMVVGALAALWPARRAARLDVLRAVTTE